MPQRAILEGHSNVLAYNTDDDIWAGLAAAYKAERLTLPCCGANAIPKQNTHGTRYFSHPPYKRIKCDWKEVTANHEAMVAAIASYVTDEKWALQTEVKYQGRNVDLLCTHHASIFKALIMIELSTREGVVDDENSFQDFDVPSLWIVGPQSKIFIGDDAVMYRLPSRYLLDDAARYVKKWLEDIEAAFQMTRQVTETIDETKWLHEFTYSRGVPELITLTNRLNGAITKIEIDNSHKKLNFEAKSFGKLASTDRQEVVDLFKSRLDDGIKLWWPGYPNLEADTFKPLADAVSKSGHHSGGKYSSSNSIWDEGRNSTARSGGISHPRIDNAVPDFGSFRCREIISIASKVMPPTEVQEWMETPLTEFNGRTPEEMAYIHSDSVRQCEVLLGLRDAKTNRPIRPI